MTMNETPSGERTHIGIFGKRNAGKSSLINAITGQELSIVSNVKGTTTDPVKKAMELLPLGPVLLIDTPGLDDEGELGQKRMEKALQMLRKTEIVLLVMDAEDDDFEVERELLTEAKKRKLPYLIACNKTDICQNQENLEAKKLQISKDLEVSKEKICMVSAKEKKGIFELKEALAHAKPQEEDRPLIRDLLKKGDVLVLVVPIDSAAPKGRLILPQQQVIRDALEAGAMPIVCRETELTAALSSLEKKPALVVTDSQAFGRVNKETPDDILLTSFSILMARYKGDLSVQIAGAKALDDLKDGDKVLISEGCTHHRQCDDIGTVKMPRWILEYTKKDLEFEFTSGGEFPKDLSKYALVVHCGGCTLNLEEMRYRIKFGFEQNVPITNYGVLIAYMNGILPRVCKPFVID